MPSAENLRVAAVQLTVSPDISSNAQRIAEQVPDLNIVVATGCYTYDDVPFFFHHRGPALNEALGAEVPDPMVDMFVADITDGIAGTGVRAAFLKCAIDRKGRTPGVERVMRAVARASVATGAPITIHTHPGTETGTIAHRVVCEEEGVDPARVVLGHSGDSTDADHLSALADTGVVLGMDRFGVNLDVTFESRADVVVEMCRRGHAGSMVLSHDAACYIDWLPEGAPQRSAPNWHFLHICRDVLPALAERGVSASQIRTMLVENPRRFLENPA